jgi:hypothetical protein
MTNTYQTNRVSITRTSVKKVGRSPETVVHITVNGSEVPAYQVSRYLTDTTSETGKGVLMAALPPGNSCPFKRGSLSIYVNLCPLTDDMCNSEWFEALDSRIAAVTQAFNKISPGSHDETYTKEYGFY